MGLSIVADEEVRSNTVNGVRMPEGVDANAVRMALLNDYNIETGGGLGPFAGKVVRVGLMGYSSQETNVLLILSALGRVLNGLDYEVAVSAGVAAASRVYAGAS